MQTGKINQRITYFMEQRQMGLESLSQKTGLDTALLDTMLTENVYPPLGKGKTDRHMEPFFVEILPESAREKKWNPKAD